MPDHFLQNSLEIMNLLFLTWQLLYICEN